MPKSIEKPIKEGLPSKIYLLCFEKPKTAYRVSRILKRQTGQIWRETTRRHPELFEKSEEEGKRRKRPILSKVEPFLNELEEALKENEIELRPSERRQLKEYLGGPFRKAVSKERNYMQVRWEEPVNAYIMILNQLLKVTVMVSARRELFDLWPRFAGLLGASKETKKFAEDHQKEFRSLFATFFEQLFGETTNGVKNPASDKEITSPLDDWSEELISKLMKMGRVEDIGVLVPFLRTYEPGFEKFKEKLSRSQNGMNNSEGGEKTE